MEGVEEETVEEEMEKKSLKIPLHATRVVYLPYLPLSIHRATIETVSIACYFMSFKICIAFYENGLTWAFLGQI